MIATSSSPVGVCRMLTRDQVAAHLGLKPSTIRKMVREGRFPNPARLGHNVVRWPETVLDDWFSRGCPPL